MGLFSKKRTYADLIIKNASVYTNDPDLPYVEAVAVSDERIIAIGNYEDLQAFESEDTEVLDLDGQYVYPGFIDCHRSVVGNALSEIEIEQEEVEIVPDDDDDDSIDAIETIDEADDDSPENEYYDMYEENPMEEIEERFDEHIESLMDAGFTTVLDLQTPNRLEDMYFDYMLEKYNEDEVKIRFFGALYVNIPVRPEVILHMLMQRKTNTQEMDDTMNAEHVYIELNNEKSETPFTEQSLSMILEVVAERGFSFYLDCANYEDLKLAYDGLEYIRSKGHKNVFVIASDSELSDVDKSNSIYWDTAIKTWGVEPLNKVAIYGKDVHGMERRIEELTLIPARMLGMEEDLGSIEVGKFADFVVYDKDLLKFEGPSCKALHSQMTILKGKVVYSLQDEIDNEMLDMMMGMHM